MLLEKGIMNVEFLFRRPNLKTGREGLDEAEKVSLISLFTTG